jgi:Asp-tRNA(Asn)/Glu-tRNA(Gln) amidotransferase A subunit family amidase
LAGVPYLLKDLGVLYAGRPTTYGSRFFATAVADHDSTLVERLRAAGLVIIGKTNTPEFGLNATTEPVLFGPSRNPYDDSRSTGGSSGGAAAAVAARMVPAAHATDGGGSIRIPAANCGLFGLKPTRARNPIGPDVGEGWSGLGVGHAVSRTVRDSAALLDATHGPAPGDPYWAPPFTERYADHVGRDPGRLKVAVTTRSAADTPVDPECVRAVEETAKLLEELGHTVEEAAPDYSVEAMAFAMKTIIASNMHTLLALRGGVLGRNATLDDVEPISWHFAKRGAACTGADYARAIIVIHGIGRRLAGFFQDYDLALSPTLADPPLPLGRTSMAGDDMDAYFEALTARIPFTPLYNVSGHPAASLPLHWTEAGLPVGVQLGAAFGAEDLLFRISAQLEEARPWHDRRPDGLP